MSNTIEIQWLTQHQWLSLSLVIAQIECGVPINKYEPLLVHEKISFHAGR